MTDIDKEVLGAAGFQVVLDVLMTIGAVAGIALVAWLIIRRGTR